ncbi:hypothetical protein QYF61_002489 [Mycteria americana]|uniref:AH domain-containing protein n=1 Tax=Mycteria americana TaxID=33587 RepID=A0AAN7NRJ5_MYCAM|nr:hypothetical protein QYF61_002489 [Mycteria americana]
MARLAASATQQAEGWASPCTRGEGAAGSGGCIRGSPRGIHWDSSAAPCCPQQRGALPPHQPGTRGLLTPSFLALQCTKQLISERFGRGSRTVDLELETQIELLRETKRKYECVLQLARAFTNHFYSLVQTQHALGDAFADLSQKSPELQEEFGYNAETQKLLCKNGETLLGAVNFFVSSINTLVNKTMEDTLMTVKQYETARLEYDAYRTDLEELSMGPRDASTLCRLDAAQSQFQSHKDKYEKLRADVAIKLKFLEENKVGRDVGLGRGRGAQSGGLLCTRRVPWPCCLAAACLRSLWVGSSCVAAGGAEGASFRELPAAALTSPSRARRGLRPCSQPLLWVLGGGAGSRQADPSCSSQIKVMHKQLLLFHNAISAYFAGNQQQLEQTLKQFNIKLKTPGAEKPSWLEEQ